MRNELKLTTLKVKWIKSDRHEGRVLPHFSTKLRVNFLPQRQTFRAQFS